MLKNFLLLCLVINLSLTSCQKDDERKNLDITVTGRVTNQNDVGVGDVTIYIQRGDGNYHYIVKNDNHSYKLCCGIPQGYTSVDEFCKFVNHNIINSQTVPNIINFKLE
jgi:hypothetical protein